jgi:cation diffusion facilitator CzcD-associated flavoprotein CzcO
MTDLPDTPLIIIGAGLSGLGTAIQLRRLQSFITYEVYEKAASLGGTWWHNTYRTPTPLPRAASDLTFVAAGCGVDVRSHFYSWSWGLNAEWSRPFVGQAEILKCEALGPGES